jgi:hypothetical protein
MGSEPYDPVQPRINDRCPACDRRTLFIGAGGLLTCSFLTCPQPCVGAAIMAQRQALAQSDRLEAENAAHKRTEEEWRAAEREWKAKIEKLVAAGDDMRQEWCGHNHGMMGTKAPRSCGRCVVEEAWDRAKGEDEGK